ncbi:hypothetical protein AMTRI_Chr13g92780 [Amborella trichopoda]|uniref:Erythronate-4-phosphate dehydrogenase family protein n=1 Tax=Amborella trichopoda TaxID=13333 RepID=U5D4W3_AMBTC|nr:uncharacterized protein At1g01500 [Amborella trichopoda]ERN17479.1 hypothetical protein AMTR_s00059p00041200 [Amborella trichopoda]|eukprot:XP_006856012.1 uncharacterized protein At1g01500 [Amborella trichopoda]
MGNEEESAALADSGNRKLVRHSSSGFQFSGLSSSGLVLRVFYVRVSNCEFDSPPPEHLTLKHLPLSAETLIEVNGGRSVSSEEVSVLLRRDRVDKQSEEATFVSTDCVRMTGSVRFEVYDRDDLLLSGFIEFSNGNSNPNNNVINNNNNNNGNSGGGLMGETKKRGGKELSMDCQSEIVGSSSFLRGGIEHGLPPPNLEVYVAGCFLGTPIILTKTLQVSFRRKPTRKGTLHSIPEYESTETGGLSPDLSSQISEYQDFGCADDDNFTKPYPRGEYIEGEDGELSWFNAGVRVGVGIGLGICLGVGVGVGLLVRTYHATTRGFKRRLL